MACSFLRSITSSIHVFIGRAGSTQCDVCVRHVRGAYENTNISFCCVNSNLLTMLPTSQIRALIQKLITSRADHEISRISHGRFITAFTTAYHSSLSSAWRIRSMPYHLIYLWTTLTISSHLCPGLPNDLFPSSLPTNTTYAFFFSNIRATCPAHHILLDFITLTIISEQYKSWSSSLCSLLQYPVTSSLLGPCNLFSNTFSLRYSVVRETKFYTHTKQQDT